MDEEAHVTGDRRRLAELLREVAVLRGEFRLASGRTAETYLDGRRLTLHPEGAVLTATAFLDWIDESGIAPDCVGGPTLGADPIVGAMVALSHQRGRPLPGFIVRKEAKHHGTGRALEGPWQPGWRAVLVEDTVTTGGSVREAARKVEAAGMTVEAILCIVDREQGGAEALAPWRFHALFRAAEVGL